MKLFGRFWVEGIFQGFRGSCWTELFFKYCSLNILNQTEE